MSRAAFLAALTGAACCFALAWFAIRPEARIEQVSYLVTLRHLVETEQRGTPDYSMLEPPVRRLAIAQSARTRAVLCRMGTLKSMRFLRQQGPEHIYELWFEHGRMLWGVIASPAGTFYGVRYLLREQG
jgi:hypothetical protein